LLPFRSSYSFFPRGGPPKSLITRFLPLLTSVSLLFCRCCFSVAIHAFFDIICLCQLPAFFFYRMFRLKLRRKGRLSSQIVPVGPFFWSLIPHYDSFADFNDGRFFFSFLMIGSKEKFFFSSLQGQPTPTPGIFIEQHSTVTKMLIPSTFSMQVFC